MIHLRDDQRTWLHLPTESSTSRTLPPCGTVLAIRLRRCQLWIGLPQILLYLNYGRLIVVCCTTRRTTIVRLGSSTSKSTDPVVVCSKWPHLQASAIFLRGVRPLRMPTKDWYLSSSQQVYSSYKHLHTPSRIDILSSKASETRLKRRARNPNDASAVTGQTRSGCSPADFT